MQPPQDWTGPVDQVEPEEIDYGVSGYERQGWEEELEDGRRSATGRERELSGRTRPEDAEPAEGSPEEEEPREDL